jgi:hypothetical protein
MGRNACRAQEDVRHMSRVQVVPALNPTRDEMEKEALLLDIIRAAHKLNQKLKSICG